jgi:hypothetical protein
MFETPLIKVSCNPVLSISIDMRIFRIILHIAYTTQKRIVRIVNSDSDFHQKIRYPAMIRMENQRIA